MGDNNCCGAVVSRGSSVHCLHLCTPHTVTKAQSGGSLVLLCKVTPGHCPMPWLSRLRNSISYAPVPNLEGMLVSQKALPSHWYLSFPKTILSQNQLSGQWLLSPWIQCSILIRKMIYHTSNNVEESNICSKIFNIVVDQVDLSTPIIVSKAWVVGPQESVVFDERPSFYFFKQQ